MNTVNYISLKDIVEIIAGNSVLFQNEEFFFAVKLVNSHVNQSAHGVVWWNCQYFLCTCRMLMCFKAVTLQLMDSWDVCSIFLAKRDTFAEIGLGGQQLHCLLVIQFGMLMFWNEKEYVDLEKDGIHLPRITICSLVKRLHSTILLLKLLKFRSGICKRYFQNGCGFI